MRCITAERIVTLLAAGFWTSVALANSAPVVSNITANQRTDGSKNVDIYYDLADANGDLCTVTVLASDDGGATWTLPITTLRGAVGVGVTPDVGKHVVWESGEDLPEAFGSQYKLSVCADDEQIIVPPGMVLIPAGVFSMGDTFDEGEQDELPVHIVELSSYFIEKHEVTKALWLEVYWWSGAHGYNFSNGSGKGKADDHPVQTVTWHDCVKWCNARSEMEGRTPCYYYQSSHTTVYKAFETDPFVNWDANGYRLPTEAEWEKAARGGIPGHRFSWTDVDTIQHSRSNYSSNSSLFAFDTSPTEGYHPDFDVGGVPFTSPVGSFAPNGYGIYDMTGNVWEWCNDWYSSVYYGSAGATQLDPKGTIFGSVRVHRDGSWDTNADRCRLANRLKHLPNYKNHSLGFRCVVGNSISRTGKASINVGGSDSREPKPDSGS